MREAKRSLEIAGSGHSIEVSEFLLVEYQDSFQAMKEFSQARTDHCLDQIWLLQHPAVYTQGTSCATQPFLPSDIGIVKTDRGGQITYHGPGQIVMYPLLNLRRLGLGVKNLVSKLELATQASLTEFGIESHLRNDAPGVYVDGDKIASLGLRISRGNSYHGLSVNVDMDLSPFTNIDPCGFAGLTVTQIKDQVAGGAVDRSMIDPSVVGQRLLRHFLALI